MPDWEKLKEKFVRGELNDVQRQAYLEAWQLGEIPAPGTEDKPFKRKLEERIIAADPATMTEADKYSLAGNWLKEIGQDHSGFGYFTDNPDGLDGDTMLKLLQNRFDPNKHKDVLTEWDEWLGMDEEQRSKNTKLLSAEGLKARAEQFAAFGLEGIFRPGEIQRDVIERNNKDAESRRRFKKDFTAMRQMYESIVTSDIGRDFAKTVAETGVWDNNVYLSIPAEQRKAIPSYIQVIKPQLRDGVATEAALTLINGVKDITLGSLEYVGDKAATAWYSAGELLGDQNSKAMLKALEDVNTDTMAEQEALELKFSERGLAGKAAVGVAGSLPLMASFYVSGPTGTLKKFGKLGSLWNQYLKRAPVAMSTLSMAKVHEDLMVSRGADRAVAAPVALLTQTFNMVVEKAELDLLLKIGKGKLFNNVNKAIVSHLSKPGQLNALVAKRIALGANVAASTGSGYITNQLEEGVQALADELSTQLAADGVVDVGGLVETVVDTFIQSSPTSLAFGVVGGAGSLMSQALPHYFDDAYIKDQAFKERIKTITGEAEITDADAEQEYERIYSEWESSDPDDRIAVLHNNGVLNVESATKAFEQEQSIRSELLSKAEVSITRSNKIEESMESLRDLMTKEGFSVEFVNTLTDAVDAMDVASVDAERNVEVLDMLSDPLKLEALRHERAHVLAEDLGVVTAEEQALLTAGVDKLVAELKKAGVKTDNIYRDMVADKKVREVVADSIAVLNPQERTVFQKVADFFEKVINFAKRNGFKSLRSVLKDIEARGSEQAQATAGQTQQAGEKRFMRRELDPVELLQGAAEQYALARVEGRSGQKFAESLAKRTGRPVDDIIARGEQLFAESNARLTEGATRIEKRKAVREAAIRKSVRTELRKARKEGAKVAKSAQKAEVDIDSDQKRKSRGVSARTAKVEHGVDVNDMIKSGADVVAVLQELADKTSHGIADKYKSQHLANTISKSLKESARRLISNRTSKSNIKSSIIEQANNISKLKLNDSIINAAQEVVDRIRDNITEQTKDDLKAEITSFLSKNGKKPRIGKREKKGSSHVQNVLYEAKNLWSLSNAIPAMTDGVDERNRVSPYDQAKLSVTAMVGGITANTTSEELDSIKRSAFDTLLAIRMIDKAKTLDTVEALDDAMSSLESFMEVGQSLWEEKQRAKHEAWSATIDSMVKDLEKRKDARKTIDPDSKQYAFKFMNPIDSIRFTFSDGAAFVKDMVDGLDEKISKAKKEGIKFVNEINSISEELGLGTIEDIQKRWSKRKEDLSELSRDGRTNLSKGELMTIIKRLERSDVVDRHFRGLSPEEAQLAVERGDTDGINMKLLPRYLKIPDMKKKFTWQELAFADFMQEEVQDLFLSIRDKVIEDTGLPPEDIDGYVPLNWDRHSIGADAVVRTVAGIPSWLLPTTRHSNDLIETDDYIFAMLGHSSEILSYKYVDTLKEDMFNTVLSRPVTKLVKKTFGNKFSDLLRNKVTEALINRPLYKESIKDESWNDTVFRHLRSTTATLSLFGRFYSMMRQAGDITAPLGTLDWKVAKQAISMMMTPEGLERARMFRKDPLVRDRLLRGFDMASEKMFDTIELVPWKIGKTMAKGGTMVPGLGDVFVMGLWGGQLEAIEVASDPILNSMKDQKEAREIARMRVFGRLSRMMQSQEAKDMNDELRHAGEAKKNVLQFLTADMPKLSLELEAAMKLLENKTDAASRRKLAKLLFVNHVLLPTPQILVSILSQWFGGDELDDDEAWEAVITILAGPLRAVAVMSSVLFALEGMIEGRRANAMSPANRTLNSAMGLFKAITDGDSWTDSDGFVKLIDKFLSMLGIYRDAKDWSKFVNEL